MVVMNVFGVDGSLRPEYKWLERYGRFELIQAAGIESTTWMSLLSISGLPSRG